jgi:hypothetical protein
VDPLFSYLFSSCYCLHCEAKAKEHGIKLSEIKKKARETLSKIINRPPDLYISIPETDIVSMFYEHLMTDEYLEQLVKFKSITSLEVIQQIRESLKSINNKVKISIITGAAVWLNEGFNLQKISKVVDAIDYICYFENPRRIENYVRILKAQTDENCWAIPSIRINYPMIYTKENLTMSLQAAINGGADGISFYNYGWTPKIIFQWIKTTINQIKYKKHQFKE